MARTKESPLDRERRETLAKEFWGRVDIAKGPAVLARICEGAGLNYHTIRAYRSELRMPPLQEAMILAREIGASLDYLVSGAQQTGDISPEMEFVRNNSEAKRLIQTLMVAPQYIQAFTVMAQSTIETLPIENPSR